MALTLTLASTNQVVKKVLPIDSILLTTHYSLLTAYHLLLTTGGQEGAARRQHCGRAARHPGHRRCQVRYLVITPAIADVWYVT